MAVRWSAAIVTILALVPSTASGESFRNAPARPLVVMTTYVRSESAAVTQVPSRVSLNSFFLFADRTLVQSFNSAPVVFGQETHVSSLTRGRVSPAEFRDIAAAMTNARIDTHRDCRIVPVGVPFFETLSEIRFRWYGRQGRTNTFTVRHGGDSGPICELEVIELLSALNGATASVSTAGTSEYFAVP